MGAEEEPLKIRDIIGRVNGIWSESHKNSQKHIFKNYLIVFPLIYSAIFSFIYLLPLLGYIFYALMQDDVGRSVLKIPFIEIYFNAPYYVFDLRSGIIASVASLLLSLYVSVGKYGDGEVGVINDARRVAYRKFARLVGGVISFAFFVNFWHGLLAGYFRRNYHPAPRLLPWECPEWCNNIVQKDMDLSRYGDMPLWILIFFAWFAYVSSALLTYSEKDLLIRNGSVVNKISRLEYGNSKSQGIEYLLAEKIFDASGTSYESNIKEYESRFNFIYRNNGVRFISSRQGYLKKIINPKGRVQVGIIALWAAGVITYSILILRYDAFIQSRISSIVTILIIVLVEILLLRFLVGALHAGFLGYETRGVSIYKKILAWVRFYCIDSYFWISFYWFAVILLLSIFETTLVPFGERGRMYSEGNFFDYALYLISMLLVFAMPHFYASCVMKPLFEDEIRRHSEEWLRPIIVEFKQEDPRNREYIDYVGVAYIYILMLRLDDLYSDYRFIKGEMDKKAEGSDTNTQKSFDRVNDYQESRTCNHNRWKTLQSSKHSPSS